MEEGKITVKESLRVEGRGGDGREREERGGLKGKTRDKENRKVGSK